MLGEQHLPGSSLVHEQCWGAVRPEATRRSGPLTGWIQPLGAMKSMLGELEPLVWLQAGLDHPSQGDSQALCGFQRGRP